MTTPGEWDAEAERFDVEPDHGLTDPAVRAAWRALLVPLLPATSARVPAADVPRAVRTVRRQADVVPLRDPALWGRAVADERHSVLSRR